jgi:hypothetical protein
MRYLLGAVVFAVVPSFAYALSGWTFSEKTAITAAPKDGVFHHLEGAGRRHIALSEGLVAVVWEDNSSADPQVYASLKPKTQQVFEKPLQLSTGDEAYEPAIAALSAGRFVVVYEQDGKIFARLLDQQGVGPALQLSTATAANASVTAYDDLALAVWREKNPQGYTLKVIRLRPAESGQLSSDGLFQVEAEAVATPMLMPAITMNQSTVCIAWEDRRAGHTRLLYSLSDLADIKFSKPGYLNEFYSNRNEYDKGNGVTRIAMARFAEDEVLAAWMDKRKGGSGYGIYAALASDGGAQFGPNEKVHSEQGEQLPHYNPAVSGNKLGDFVVAWDDFRQGDSDIWLSFYNDDSEWGSDVLASVASGAGEQTHASVTMDEQGGLHLVWVEREDRNAPSRLWYSYAAPRP